MRKEQITKPEKKKEVVFIIEYRLPIEDVGFIGESLDFLRQYGTAETIEIMVK